MRLEERVHGLLIFVVIIPETYFRHVERGVGNRHAESRVGVGVASMTGVLIGGTVVTHIPRFIRDVDGDFLGKFGVLGRLVVGVVNGRRGDVLLGYDVDGWEDEIGRGLSGCRWGLRGSRRLCLEGPLRSLTFLH